VRHDRGPLLILAGAGSGKTRVITHRIAWLVRVLGVRPAQILAITFTNKAAAEMKTRIEGLIGNRVLTMWVGTFHSMLIRVLRRFADRLGFDRSFAIIDTHDQLKGIRACIAELRLDEKAFPPKNVHGQIGSWKNALIGPKEQAVLSGSDYRLSRIAEVYPLHQDKPLKSNSMDFDDTLAQAPRLFPELIALELGAAADQRAHAVVAALPAPVALAEEQGRARGVVEQEIIEPICSM